MKFLVRLSYLALFVAGVTAGVLIGGRGADRDDVISMPAASAAPATAPEQRPSISAPAAAAPLVGGPDFTVIAERTVKAVTNISSVQNVRRRTSPFMNDPFFQYFFGDQGDMFGQSRAEQSLGSGVVISSDGYVVTNNHVIGDDVAEITVTVGERRDVKAKIIGVDPTTDIGLLKIEATNLPVIPWGDSSKLKVAEWVLAVGNPFSLSQTVTLGIVSALGRNNMGITQYEDFIQTDAAINPGNSGGALINSRGELIGINTAIFSQSGGYQGIGFAVPSNLVRRIVDALTKYGSVRRGSVGIVEVQPLTSRLADALRAPKADGVVVTRLLRDGSAYKNGIRPGDVIVTVNGTAVADPAQFVRMIADSQIGSTARVEVVSDGQRSTVRIPVEAQNQPRRRQR